jgi:DNA polymerase-3 subunit gamma/tau
VAPVDDVPPPPEPPDPDEPPPDEDPGVPPEPSADFEPDGPIAVQPQEAAIKLLTTQLGARPVDRR